MNDMYVWKESAKEFMMVGSRVTCDPPPMDTDEDWIVLDIEGVTSRFLNDNLWHLCTGDYEDENNDLATKDMTVYRMDYVNVLCMHSADQYFKFKLATKVSKHLNIMNKADRIMLFEAIRYGRGL